MVTVTNPRHTEAEVVNFVLPAATSKSQKTGKPNKENQIFDMSEVSMCYIKKQKQITDVILKNCCIFAVAAAISSVHL